MDRKIDDLNPILSKITMLVAAIKSLRFALFYDCIHCELHSYNIADGDYLATQRTRSSSAIVLSHLTRNILISTHETFIFWENGLFNGSVHHLLDIIIYIPSQWLAFQTNPNIPKELKQVTTTAVWFSAGGSDIRKFHHYLFLTCNQSSIIETLTFKIHFKKYFPITSDIFLALLSQWIHL